VRSTALAEDVTQETLVTFWRARDAFSGERGAAGRHQEPRAGSRCTS
jgi:DNA-directed RNA polymerase specialized sigma24 family protein